ncbi:MAG: 3-isopropylmalate dehydratase [Chloroflexi bacterium]|nr:MAG: 3-isopropylmalate dehydratase [Chloroflexota bacterium]
MQIQGRTWKYGDNINTDVIFPGKYTYTVTERPTFAANVRPGDIIVAGRNWGCGSSREQAATCLVYNGVAAVVAASFSRIFYRNALNNGLLAIGCPAAVAAIEPGETITIDLVENRICCATGEFSFPPLSASVLGIVQAGGLVAYVKRKLAAAP